MTGRRVLAHAILVLFTLAPVFAANPEPRVVELPVEVVENRFFVTPSTASGDRLRFYTDTGGGLFVRSAAAARLKLHTKKSTVEGETLELTQLPTFRPGASIPGPIEHDGLLPVLPPDQDKQLPEAWDGMLGQAWFAGRVWTWDYPGHRLSWIEAGGLPGVAAVHRVQLGFKSDGAGKRLANFARIQATVDGQELELLLDTGAMVVLTPQALGKLGEGTAVVRATSFIVATDFDRWHTKHPDWRLIDGADANAKGEPMIEVPAVTLAGYTVGPVWFTRRPDANFLQHMSQWTDRPIEGALGGSALRFFRLSVDYPGASAVFEKP